jgi:hypothetical protein
MPGTVKTVSLLAQTITSYEDPDTPLDQDEWDNPENAGAQDATYTSCDGMSGLQPATERLRCTNWDNEGNLPDDAHVTGISVRVRWYDTNGHTEDSVVTLTKTKNETTFDIGDNQKTGVNLPTTPAERVYGGNGSLWNAEPYLTVALLRGDVADEDWGVDIALVMDGQYPEPHIDVVIVTIYYLDGGEAELHAYDNDNGGAEVESGATIDLGECPPGQEITRQFTLCNEGEADCDIGTVSGSDDVSIDDMDDPSDETIWEASGPRPLPRGYYGIGVDDLVPLLPSGVETVTIEVDTSTEGTKTGTLTIPSNDPDTPFTIDFTLDVDEDNDPQETCVQRYRGRDMTRDC